jgi:protein TonB
MFERSLIASQVQYASVEQKWTATVSIALQIAAAGLVIALPLFHQEVLQLKSDPPRAFVQMKPPVVKMVKVEARAVSAATSAPMAAQTVRFEAPTSVPPKIKMGPDEGPPREFAKIGGGMDGGFPAGLGAIGDVPARVVTVASPPHSDKPMRVSAGVTAGMLMAPIRPVYPQIAKAARVEGAVVVEAIISKAGVIESLHVVSGPEMLRGAAIEAIREARYQPYRLNGEPTEVQTTITVNFKIGG